MPTIELHITGKVQGVFYRASTRKKAGALGLAGWVKNMPDGSVLVRASGGDEQLNQLAAWCRRGPDRAVVENVAQKNLPEETFEKFIVIQ